MNSTFTYSDVFKNIKGEVIQATKDLIKGGIFKKDLPKQDKAILMGLWIQVVSRAYDFEEVPKFYFVDDRAEYNRTGGGCYFPSKNEIYIFYKPSFTTLLHEFRHAMQFQKGIKMFRNEHEEDARAWSVSLYKLSAPKTYKNAVEKGLLHFT